MYRNIEWKVFRTTLTRLTKGMFSLRGPVFILSNRRQITINKMIFGIKNIFSSEEKLMLNPFIKMVWGS